MSNLPSQRREILDGSCQSEEELIREVTFFHQCYFKTRLAEEVIERYITANRQVLPPADEPSAKMLNELVSRKLDIEAVEFVLRLKNRENLLSKKLQILFFLLEVRRDYIFYFFCFKRGKIQAIAGILSAVMLSIGKYVKGSYLLWRHKLV